MAIRKVVPIELAEWRIEPPPAWVDEREPDWDYMAAPEYTVAFLLLDEQHHVATRSLYHRTVRRLLTHSAVQTLGQVEVEFDPSAYRVFVHELAVWRRGADGSWTSRSLALRENFMLRQREQQLEQQMLHGRVSLMALLEDVRVDDAIEMAWTLEPRDEMPGLRFTAMQAFAWVVPVARMAFTLHLSREHPVQWRMHTRANIATPIEEITETRATWRLERPDVFVSEPNVPGGHWEFAFLEASGWQNWAEVAAFAADLWTDALADATTALEEEAQKLRTNGDELAAARAAIRFVQEEIRYLAVDFGHGGGILPNGSGTVLRRRFGDCKDKSVLLVALLRSLGIEAYPLLVPAGWRDAVSRLQPSTAAFNHAIVTFFINGKRQFVDPTLVGQGGDFHRLIAPPYGRGLEVRHGATELITLPEVPAAELILKETFTLDRNQLAGTVEQDLRVTSWLADEVRSALVRQGRAAFFKGRAEALQNIFPALVPGEGSAAGEVLDDMNANTLTVRSLHGLPTWGPAGEKPPIAFSYGAHGLWLAIDQTGGPEQRKQPWALRFPMLVRHVVVVRGKTVRKRDDEQFEVTGPGFRYSCRMVSIRGQTTFQYQWETTAHEVKAEQWPEYCRQRAKAFERTGANVIVGQPMSRAMVAFAIVMAGLCIWIVIASTAGSRSADVQRSESSNLADKHALAYRNARAEAQRGEFVAAEPTIERLRSRYTGNFDFHTLRAEVAIGTGRMERAREALVAARSIATTQASRPGILTVDLLEARLKGKLGDLAGARALLEKASDDAPDDSRPLFGLAQTCQLLGDLPAARAAWEKVLKLSPGKPAALRSYSQLLWNAGEHERADALWSEAQAAHPAPSAEMELALSSYYTETGRHKEAVSPASRAAQLAPNDPLPANRYVMALCHDAQHATAIEAARKMTVRFPTSALAWAALATAASQAKDLDTARPAFRSWIDLAPRDPNALASYGYFLLQSGQPAEAGAVLEKALRDFPRHGLLWLNYADTLSALGNEEAAGKARAVGRGLITPQQQASILR